jgi:hypothetical protein
VKILKNQFKKYFVVREVAHVDFLIRFLFLSVVSLIIIFLGWPIYGTTDDNILAGFVDGSYTGEREKRLIFIRPLIGNILYLLQGVFPGVGMYSTFLTLILILSFSTFGTVIFSALFNHESKNIFQYSWYSISFVTIVWFTLTPTYTAASILVTALTLMTITLYIFLPTLRKNILTPVILGCMFSCGFLIRPEGALGVLVVSSGIIIYFGFRFKKVNFQSLILIVSTFFVFILLDYLLQISSSNSEWEKYDRWNGLRHQVQHRVSQNYLGNLREQINWSIPEYHLFMDLSFGDEKVFNYQWLKPGFESTNFTRGVNGTLNVNFAENVVKIFNLIGNYYYLILLQLLIAVIYLLRSDLSLKAKIIFVTLLWAPLLSALYYTTATLHTPTRSIFPLLLLPTIFLITLLPSIIIKNFSKCSYKFRLLIGLFVALISFALGSNLIDTIKSNLNEKNLAIILKNELNEFSEEGLFLGPGNTEIYETRNPYIGKAQWESPKMITVGNWETFSPYWYKRSMQFGITDTPIYAALFSTNIYWLSNPAPDTSYFIELFLRENGQNELSRQNVIEFLGGQRLFKFEN